VPECVKCDSVRHGQTISNSRLLTGSCKTFLDLLDLPLGFAARKNEPPAERGSSIGG